jgi:hypothetical protein
LRIGRATSGDWMSTAKYDGDENGYATCRYARLRFGLLPVAVLLISGCDVVLGIDAPVRGPGQTGPGLGEAGNGADGGIEGEAGASGSDAPTIPPEPACEDGVLRCDDSTSGNRSKCTDGEWAEYDACGVKEQCDSQADAACTALPVEGEPCDDPGTYKCTGVAKPERRICDEDDMVWVDGDPCASGEACDRTDGECLPIVAACAGRMPGDFVCDGLTRHACGQDLTASVPAECMSAAHCQQSKGATCALCTQGEFRCEGAILQTCNAAGDGWTMTRDCREEPLCNAEAGDCTTATCTEGQYRCSGNQLLLCNAEHTGWDMVRECLDGLCDQANGQCDVCSASHCDENMRMLCSADRQTLEPAACAEDLVCTGEAECVECAGPTDCPGVASVCGAPICNRNHECGMNIMGEPGAACGGGNVCDLEGGCADWSLDQLTPDSGPELQSVTIRAKADRIIHAPGLMDGAQAMGTSVEVRENGVVVELPGMDVVAATPAEGTMNQQQIRITMPMRHVRWVATERVSIVVRYTPPVGRGTIGALEFTYSLSMPDEIIPPP